LPSRLNGKVGGLMVRKMIEYAEQSMMSSPQALQQVEMQPGATQNDVNVAQQSLAAANAFMNQFQATQQLPNTGFMNQPTPVAQQPMQAVPQQFAANAFMNQPLPANQQLLH
jgi:hypothetical protein